MMRPLLIEPTVTSQWQSLVQEAQQATQHRLDETLESYLVFLLIRFTQRSDIAQRIVAIDYLTGLTESGHLRSEKLRDVGDLCLLTSGLFPQRAQKRRVKISYFVDIGRSAYHELGHTVTHGASDLYISLSEDFVSLMDILQSMRANEHTDQILSPLAAYDLWRDTGSKAARDHLQRHSPNAMPLAIDSDNTFQ